MRKSKEDRDEELKQEVLNALEQHIRGGALGRIIDDCKCKEVKMDGGELSGGKLAKIDERIANAELKKDDSPLTGGQLEIAGGKKPRKKRAVTERNLVVGMVAKSLGMKIGEASHYVKELLDKGHSLAKIKSKL